MLVPLNIHVVGNVMDGAKMIRVVQEFVMFWIAEKQKIGSTLGAEYSLMTGLIFDSRRLRKSIIPSRRPLLRRVVAGKDLDIIPPCQRLICKQKLCDIAHRAKIVQQLANGNIGGRWGF